MIDFQNYEYGDAPIMPMFKPYFDVSEMSEWNLDHVNAYFADITIDREELTIDIKNVEFKFNDFKDTGYHEKIEKMFDGAGGIKENEELEVDVSGNTMRIDTTVELTDDEKSLHRSSSHIFDLDEVIRMDHKIKHFACERFV